MIVTAIFPVPLTAGWAVFQQIPSTRKNRISWSLTLGAVVDELAKNVPEAESGSLSTQRVCLSTPMRSLGRTPNILFAPERYYACRQANN